MQKDLSMGEKNSKSAKIASNLYKKENQEKSDKSNEVSYFKKSERDKYR